MRSGFVRWLSATVLTAAISVAAAAPGFAVGPPVGGGGDTPTLFPGAQPLPLDDETEQRLLELDLAFMTRQTAGDIQLTNEQAGEQRINAAGQADAIKKAGLTPVQFNGAWSGLGPNPVVQVTRSGGGSFAAMS